MTRRPTRSRAYAPDPDAPGRNCDAPGCPAAGEYRAPKSRHHLREYWWLCLEHVRAYNAHWDFYKGMSPGQIEAELRADTAWQRPSWPLGHLGARLDAAAEADPLGFLAAGGLGRRGGRAVADPDAPPAAMREPLATLGLDWPVTIEEVKSRYKELAKRHHPDANQGSRDAEERLKDINLAYAALRSHLAPPALRAG
jgi:DnaJ-domain-containing protein 1